MILRKKLIIAAGVVVSLTAAGVAYAAFTATGTGGGNGSVSNVAPSRTVRLDIQPFEVAADGAAIDVLVDITNTSTKGNAIVKNVLVKVDDVVKPNPDPEGPNVSVQGTCPLGDFKVLDLSEGTTLVKDVPKTVHAATIQLLDDPDVNQDDCLGATLVLSASVGA